MTAMTTADQAEINKLKYALSHQVPDMTRGFTIHTNYGDIDIDPDFAESFRNLTADVLQFQLNRLRLL